MGNKPTKENTFPLAQLPAAKYEELTSDSYTVLRTSGELDEGFRIPRAGHICKEDAPQGFRKRPYEPQPEPGWVHAHAWDGQKDSQTIASDQASGNVQLEPFTKWKVHLVKYREGSDICDVCGWRTMMPDSGVGAPKPTRTFWPTRLKPEEREAWWLEMDALLGSLKRYSDLTPSERANMSKADTVESQEPDEDAAERAEFAARHSWWAAFDAEHAALKAVIKADKEAEGLSPEEAALFAKSVSDDIMGKKQRDVLAAIPEGAPKIWPSGAIEIWVTQKAKARILAEVKLAFPDLSLEDQEKRTDYAYKNPEYWYPYSSWLKATTPEERVKQMAYANWARDSPKSASFPTCPWAP